MAQFSKSRGQCEGRGAARCGADDDCDARGSCTVWDRRARERTGTRFSGEDRHDKRFHRCVVYRIYSSHHGGRVGRERRQTHIAREKRNGSARGAANLARIYEQAVEAYPAQDFQNVVPLEKEAGGHQVKVDTPDTAPPADAAEQGLTHTQALPPAKTPVAPPSTVTPAAASAVVKPLEKISAPKPN